jgi:hypothetical protein
MAAFWENCVPGQNPGGARSGVGAVDASKDVNGIAISARIILWLMPLPQLLPMLLGSQGGPFNHSEYLFELK